MNKTELIAQLARKQTHLSKKDVNLAVNRIIKILQDGLSISNRIEIRGFGTFTLRLRSSRSRISLKTGQEIVSPAYHTFHFKPAKELRVRVSSAGKNANIK